MARRISVWLAVFGIIFSTLTGFAPTAQAGHRVGDGEALPPTPVPALAVTLGRAETNFPSHGRYRGRAHNVRLAAENLDGFVLAPGGELSFNEIVGHRTLEAGFDYAPVIANGRIRRGVGGGVCQVATTLNLAATEAGLTVLERRAHSRPASYAPAGQDATVVDGRVDYRLMNPYAFPVAVRVKTTESNTLIVTVSGAERVAPTTVTSVRVRVLPAGERQVDDATLAAGAHTVEQPGRDGQVVRVVYERDGETRTEVVRYAPAPRIVHVGS